jgi:hypothetical protein
MICWLLFHSEKKESTCCKQMFVRQLDEGRRNRGGGGYFSLTGDNHFGSFFFLQKFGGDFKEFMNDVSNVVTKI